MNPTIHMGGKGPIIGQACVEEEKEPEVWPTGYQCSPDTITCNETSASEGRSQKKTYTCMEN